METEDKDAPAAPLKTVFEYIDYRKYLAEYYGHQKRTTKAFSYRYFAKRARVSSPSFLKFIIDGKRNLTSPMIEKFAEALRLGPREAKYFTSLVHFNQAKTAKEKQDHYAALRFLGNPAFEEVLEGGQHEYFERWAAPVIRELICLRDFRDDWDALGRSLMPAVSPEEAESAVKLLLKLGLIVRRADGRYAQTRKGIAADTKVVVHAVRAFHARMMDHARWALLDVDKRERNMSSVTMSVTPSSYDAIVEEIMAFKDRVKSIVHGEEGGSRVYQFNLELFPVSRDLDRWRRFEGRMA